MISCGVKLVLFSLDFESVVRIFFLQILDHEDNMMMRPLKFIM